MIAIDTSALMAFVLGETQSDECGRALRHATELVMSAGTLAEVLLVAERKNVGRIVEKLIDDLGIQIDPVTPAAARRVAAAHSKWGKGLHPAGLNFGDCFAYEVALTRDCPLLFIGNDFAKTDLRGVL